MVNFKNEPDKPNDEQNNRHQERLGGTAIELSLTFIKRNVAGSFFWLLFFAAKEK